MTSPPVWYGNCENLRIATGLTETSNLIEAIGDIYHGTKLTLQCYQQGLAGNTTRSYLGEFLAEIRYFVHLDFFSVIFVLALTILWTILRQLLVKNAFQPLARRIGVLPKNVEKFGESAWKGLAYSIIWCFAFYVTFFCGYDFYQHPASMFADGSAIQNDIALVYALEASFYLHGIYATIYMDFWRKDSGVMLTHHVVTLWLLAFSYSIGFIKIGVIIFVLDDIADITLEVGKIASYLRQRTTGYSTFFGIFCDVSLVVFALQWFILRLIFHVTKVWRAATIGIWMSMPVLPIPLHIFFIGFLSTLYIFYCYWFAFIILFLIRILRGTTGTLEDPREVEEEEEHLEDNDKKVTKSPSLRNGFHKTTGRNEKEE